MSESGELPGIPTADADPELSVILRELQIELWDRLGELGRIQTVPARDARTRKHVLYHRVAEVAYALEEGRLTIEPRTDEHIMAAAAEELSFQLGPDGKEPDYGRPAE